MGGVLPPPSRHPHFQRPASMIVSGLSLKTLAILVGSVAALRAVQFFFDFRRLLRSIKWVTSSTIFIVKTIIISVVQSPSRVSNYSEFSNSTRKPDSPNTVGDLGSWSSLEGETYPYVAHLSCPNSMVNVNFKSIRGEGPRYNFGCELREPPVMYQMLIFVGVILA